MFTVCLDPGHGGKDRYNRGPTGYVEADGVLDIALKCRDILQNYPVEVVLTRERDITLEPEQRVRVVNNTNADIVVSIHTNAGSADACGTETYHSIFSPEGQKGNKLATLIQQNVCAECGTYDRGVKIRKGSNGKDYYFIIRETKMTAVICEVAFHTNSQEEALLKTDDFRMKAAKGIAKGILAYADIPFKETSPEKEGFELEYGIVIGGFADYPAVEPLAEKYNAGIFLPEVSSMSACKNIFVCGASADVIKEKTPSSNVIDLSGADRYETYANISEFLKNGGK